MDDLSLQKIAISGSTFASIIQRFSSSPGDVDGLLFGHVSQPTPFNLPDDDALDSSSTGSDSSTLVATVTGFFCSGTISSFYDSTGRLDVPALRRFLGDRAPGRTLLGWFMGRRRTTLRPSMKEFNVSSSLASRTLTLTLNSPDEPLSSLNFLPCVFILFTTPLAVQLIHTHEHRAFQFRRSIGVFEPKSMDFINIGPTFRGHYGAFSPNSPFPLLSCVLRESAVEEMVIEEDKRKDGSMVRRGASSKEQQGLDLFADGFDVGRLSRLMGSDASNYTSELEDLYGKMLTKLEGLARIVEKSSGKVLEQEQRNMKLRSKFAGLG